MRDELVMFSAFVALAQIVVGLVMVLAGFTTAVQIIGAVVLVLGILSAVGPLIGRRRGERRGADKRPPAGRTEVSPPAR